MAILIKQGASSLLHFWFFCENYYNDFFFLNWNNKVLPRVPTERLVIKIKLPKDCLKFVFLDALNCNVEHTIFSAAFIT